MIRLLKLFGNSLILALLLTNSACQNMQISDYPLTIRLPATKECFTHNALTGQETRLSKPKCDDLLDRSIHITSATWKLMRGDIQTNCQLTQCKQLSGAADSLFLAIDQALKNVPAP